MKRLLAGVLTVVLMGFLGWSALRGPAADPERSPAGVPTSNPIEARIHELLQNAWNGNVSAYLAAFDGPIRSRLEREVQERGRDAFATDLRRAARSRKSHAVFSPEVEGDASARITVETVYPDRNERQTYRLERAPGGWLVTEVDTVRSHQPKARYGTPASYQEPEGPPVQSRALSVETGDEPVEESKDPSANHAEERG